MKTCILIIMLSGHDPAVYLTQACDSHIRALSVQMPDADLYCIEPSYKVRPVARPQVAL